MESVVAHSPKPLLEYDALRRRLWIFGQRCHHGATGSVVTAAAALGLVVDRPTSPSLIALAATGGLLMAHDWKDKSIWFERGRGTQP
jgi:hypothetical protein